MSSDDLTTPVVFRKDETDLALLEKSPVRIVGPERSKTMAVGLACFNALGGDYTVLYDEVIYVIEGRFRFTVAGKVTECDPGDVVWLPEGCTLRYDGDNCKAFLAIAPVDWRERHGVQA